MALCHFFWHLRWQRNIGFRTRFCYITFKFSANRQPMNTNVFGNLQLGMMPCLQSGFDLISIFKAELFVIVHDNTNISSLAETYRTCPVGLYFRVALMT